MRDLAVRPLQTAVEPRPQCEAHHEGRVGVLFQTPRRASQFEMRLPDGAGRSIRNSVLDFLLEEVAKGGERMLGIGVEPFVLPFDLLGLEPLHHSLELGRRDAGEARFRPLRGGDQPFRENGRQPLRIGIWIRGKPPILGRDETGLERRRRVRRPRKARLDGRFAARSVGQDERDRHARRPDRFAPVGQFVFDLRVERSSRGFVARPLVAGLERHEILPPAFALVAEGEVFAVDDRHAESGKHPGDLLGLLGEKKLAFVVLGEERDDGDLVSLRRRPVSEVGKALQVGLPERGRVETADHVALGVAVVGDDLLQFGRRQVRDEPAEFPAPALLLLFQSLRVPLHVALDEAVHDGEAMQLLFELVDDAGHAADGNGSVPLERPLEVLHGRRHEI